MVDYSLYIHIPFCVHRCGYCDFNTYAGIEELIPAYSRAVCMEIQLLAQSALEKLPVHTVYFGGGTPSLIPEAYLESILETIRSAFLLPSTPEITVEANPGTVSQGYLQNIHVLGVNRISFGMQSANQAELTLLERQHSFADVVRSKEWARITGINNLNLDLIYGLPGQGLSAWIRSLEAALALSPEHLSLYALTLEHGTPLQHKIEKGILSEPDQDLAADMYESARDALGGAGYIHYEISNWARLNDGGELLSCRHNLQYWRNLPYLGVGAGAHGYINSSRTVNVAAPASYIHRLKNTSVKAVGSHKFPRTPATIAINAIDREAEIGETMMVGLRLVLEGVSNKEFQKRFGIRLQDKFSYQIDRLISLGLLEWTGEDVDRLRLTPKGYLLGNQVFKEFI